MQPPAKGMYVVRQTVAMDLPGNGSVSIDQWKSAPIPAISLVSLRYCTYRMQKAGEFVARNVKNATHGPYNVTSLKSNKTSAKPVII